MQSVKMKLKDFKLSGIYRNLEERLSYAREKSLSYLDFLTLLLEDEQNNRRENSYRKRYNKAKLPAQKQIEDFDFSFQPSVDKRTINDCSTCQFITARRNIVLIGNPGTGKTHLAIGIAMKALLKGYKILFTSVSQMLRELNFGRADNSYYQKLDYYLKPDLLILDELGFKRLPGYSADDFFEVIARRYETGSLIITTNKPFDKLGDIFTDNTMASAILDRVVHHSVVIQINGPSYRAKDLKTKGGEG
jgi:DNA replication protein DnaC